LNGLQGQSYHNEGLDGSHDHVRIQDNLDNILIHGDISELGNCAENKFRKGFALVVLEVTMHQRKQLPVLG
jgi:hypothetical protein